MILNTIITVLIIGFMLRSTTTRIAAVLLAWLLLAATGCSNSRDDNAAGLTIVATTTILGDLAQNVAGNDATVSVLLPVGVDPHDYQASSQQVAAMHEADLVLAVGLGLEAALSDTLSSLESDGANILEIAEILDPLPFVEAKDPAELDPHVWLDPLRMADASGHIANALAALDPTVDWSGRARSYAAELRSVHEQLEQLFSTIPGEGRKLVTNHDAVGYLAARYDFEVVGTVIPGGATIAEPSSSQLAKLVEEIERQNVRAIFAETIGSSTLAEAISEELNRDVEVVELYSGSLGEAGSDADTLLGMLLVNGQLIVSALT